MIFACWCVCVCLNVVYNVLCNSNFLQNFYTRHFDCILRLITQRSCTVPTSKVPPSSPSPRSKKWNDGLTNLHPWFVGRCNFVATFLARFPMSLNLHEMNLPDAALLRLPGRHSFTPFLHHSIVLRALIHYLLYPITSL